MDDALKTPDENDRTEFEKMLDDIKKGIVVKKTFTWHIDFNGFFDKIRRLFK